MTTLYIFPSIKLPVPYVDIGNVIVYNKNHKIQKETIAEKINEYAFSLFKDPYGNEPKFGVYFLGENYSILLDTCLLLQYAFWVPRLDMEFDMSGRGRYELADWYELYVSEKNENQNYELNFVSKNGYEIWEDIMHEKNPPYIQLTNDYDRYLFVSEEGIKQSRNIAKLFVQDDEYDIETIKLAKRIRKSLYWYNESFLSYFSGTRRSISNWDHERQLLFLAIAFETLFQPPKSDIQKHLATSLNVLFPDNEFVHKWFNQLYKIRGSIAHGSSPSIKDLEFKPDKEGHLSLLYWSQRISELVLKQSSHNGKLHEKVGYWNL